MKGVVRVHTYHPLAKHIHIASLDLLVRQVPQPGLKPPNFRDLGRVAREPADVGWQHPEKASGHLTRAVKHLEHSPRT